MQQQRSRLRSLRRAGRASLIAGAAWIGYSALVVRHHLPLPHALSGDRREHAGRGGRMSYYVKGEGPPLLLLHSVNAAASAAEVKPIFEHACMRHRVYAPDLPGFGFSDRSARSYDIGLYVDAVHDMLQVIADDAGAVALDAAALSLSSEFLARAAVAQPERLRSLSLVNPTGFAHGAQSLRASSGATREVPGLHGLFTFPVWSRALYDLLVSKRSIRYFLRRAWGSARIDEGLAEYDYLSAHQPGARHAPYAFVSGRLFGKDIRNVYEQLTLPVWMPHGTRGDFGDFSEAGWTRTRDNWRVQAFDSGALPHFERPQEFLAAFDRFLARVARSAHAAGLV